MTRPRTIVQSRRIQINARLIANFAIAKLLAWSKPNAALLYAGGQSIGSATWRAFIFCPRSNATF
jgi:mannose/cellobiose epimerase-like protein (N-acyl-D-glucosamine 2-epimerase family)